MLQEAKDPNLLFHPRTIKFAQPLYDIQEFVYQRINKPLDGPKDRRLLQFLGTDWGRSIDENLWVNIWRVEARMHTFKYARNVVLCDDCRFDNEAEQVKALGGTIINVVADAEIRSKRAPLVNTEHASEAGINEKYIDMTIYNNGSMRELRDNVRYLYETVL